MPKQIIQEGETYGRLKVIGFSHVNKRGSKVWLCECSCGNTKEVVGSNLKSGKTKSCGCLNRDKKPEVSKRMKGNSNATTHGCSGTPTWQSWRAMKERCNENRRGYESTTYDPRWNDFKVFLKEMGERPDGTTLDKDIKGDGTYYSKETCMWATAEEQQRHSGNAKLTEQEVSEVMTATGTLRAIAKRFGVSHQTIYKIKTSKR